MSLIMVFKVVSILDVMLCSDLNFPYTGSWTASLYIK